MERAKVGSAFLPPCAVHRLAECPPLLFEVRRRVGEGAFRPLLPDEARLPRHHRDGLLKVGSVIRLVQEFAPCREHPGQPIEELRVIEEPPPVVPLLRPRIRKKQVQPRHARRWQQPSDCVSGLQSQHARICEATLAEALGCLLGAASKALDAKKVLSGCMAAISTRKEPSPQPRSTSSGRAVSWKISSNRASRK